MPFITEELWQNLYERKEGESIMVSPLETLKTLETLETLEEMETLKQIVSGVRNIRASKNIPQKELLSLYFENANNYPLAELLTKLANVEMGEKNENSGATSTFIVGTTEYAVPMDKFIDVEEELKKLEADLQHQQGFLRGVMAKLSNERFVQNAKPEIVALEQKKKSDAEARIAALEEAIKALKA
jgi:valyl-tRNA synthetase